EIAIVAHDATDAHAAADALDEVASGVDAPVLHAMAHQTRGATLTQEDDPAPAIHELRTALRHWTELDAPFEAAQTRRWPAVASRRSGDDASALLELQAAKETFERLGARRDVERCDELIGQAEGGAERRVTKTFMFTDIVGSTDLIGTIGDEAWNDVVNWHDETLRSVIGSHRGQVVRTTGDGVFASFDDAGAALDCAIE